MVDVVTLGETMFGLTPMGDETLQSATTFQRFIGGAESNVAIGVAKLGHKAGWISRLGDDAFGRAILDEVQSYGVDVSRVRFSSAEPTAAFFKGRATGAARLVAYYRKGSAMSEMTPDDLDHEYIASARVLHVSGITLALSEASFRTALRAMEIARENGVLVTFDPNYRPQLWSEDEARAAFQKVIRYIDVLLPGEDEVGLFLDPQSGSFNLGHSRTSWEKHLEQLAGLGVSAVYMKLGEVGATYWTNGEVGFEPALRVEVVDTVGAGDAFAAGVIAGHLEGLAPREITRLGNVMGALATTAVGDTEGVTDRAAVDRWLTTHSQSLTMSEQ